MQVKDIANSIKSLCNSILNINKSINKLETKSAITIKLNSTISDFSVNNQNQLVELDQEYSRRGTGLTLSNGKIIVGAGISYLCVSASLGGYLTANGSGYFRLGICKNNSGTLYMRRDAGITRRLDMNLTNILLEVKEGDEISLVLEASSNQSTSLEQDITYMTAIEI